MSNARLYDKDFFAWANEQAALLREGKFSQADIEHIADEIESMGKREKRELVSQLTALIAQLLEWRYQPTTKTPSARASIEVQRMVLSDHLNENPSLKALVPDVLENGYQRAVLDAITESGRLRSTFPSQCPWTFMQVMDQGFWPD